MTPMLQTIVLTALIGSTVLGFLSCLILYRYTKFRVYARPSVPLRCIYQWGMAFFAGVALIAINWGMGSAAPVPIKPLHDDVGRVGFANLAMAWACTCLAGFMIQRAFRVFTIPDSTPEGRQLQVATNRTIEHKPVKPTPLQHRPNPGNRMSNLLMGR